MPAPDLIFGKVRYTSGPAELAPVLANLARPPTLAPCLRPDVDPFVAIALEGAIARITIDDDPVVLAIEQ